MVKLCIDNNIINKISSSYIACPLSLSLWHDRLGHVSIRKIKNMIKSCDINYDINEFDKCEVCVKSKLVKKPFPSVERSSNLLDLVHTDICELNGILTRSGKRYFITFIDDCSRFVYVYLLKHKDEALTAFKSYKLEVENQSEKKIKILRSDRGGEYFSNDFINFCEDNGIIHQCTAPYTPQQNGLAERKNRTLVEMLNAMLVHSKLPLNL